MTKLRGWEFTGTHQPLKFVEKEQPVLKPGYVRLKVKNAGLCHSDVGALEDPWWMEIISAPVILGHENAGEIVELGPDVKDFKIGDRVAVCPMMYDGEYGAGYGRDGGYANYVTAPTAMLVRVPDSVDMAQAAASTDAGMTSYHAVVKKGGVKKGTKVGIIGLGGLGVLGMDVAIKLGAEVYVATRKEVAQEKAKKAGAHKVASSILDFKDDNLEVIVDFAGAGKTTNDAIATVSAGGKVVLVGMANLDVHFNGNDLILKQVELVGSCGGTKEDIEDVLGLMEKGLRIEVEEIPLKDVPAGLERLKQGKADNRLVMKTTEEDYK